MKGKEEIQVQLSPYGEFPQTREDGTQVRQVCDEEAFRRLVDSFEPGDVPVDFDHGIESDDGSTRAAAWISRIWVDPDKGLMASLALTPSGEEAIVGREYRYLSPAWILAEDGRPEKLVSVAFTNRPNLPVTPVMNARKPVATMVALNISNSASGAAGGLTTNPNKIKMEELKKALGLDETADEAAVIASVQALLSEIEQMRREKAEAEMEAEAEEFANACDPETPEQKEEIKNAYKISPEATKMLEKNIRRTALQKILNTAAAKTPELPRKSFNARAEMAALPPSERKAFFRQHRADF